ncbi:MAG: hypothetical protein LBU51_04080 [Bacteroidales bacterium]|jgi:hypothetical protein|nr:hypothetical protein [Bacteroidales bacterium]
MNYIDKIIEMNFKNEEVKYLNEINNIPLYEKNIQQRDSNYYKIVTNNLSYFVKVKRNLQNEIMNYNILKNIISVPHIYYYGKISADNMDYIVEEYIESVNLYQINIKYSLYKPIIYSAGKAFGKVFNLKRKINNFYDDIDLLKLNNLSNYEKELFQKYYGKYYMYDGFILFDVAYLCSISKIELVKIADLENCLYDDIRPYISIYKQLFGEEFILGFNASSNIEYDKLEIIDKEEYFCAQIIKEKLVKFL